MQRALALAFATITMVVASGAAAQPGATPAQHAPEDTTCESVYAEPTVAIGSTRRFTGDILVGGRFTLNRAAFGLSLRDCAHGRFALRFGAALAAASDDLARSTPLGVGLEAELSYPVAPDVRLGARLGLDHHSFLRSATSDGTTVMPMLGVRARVGELVAVGVDAAYVHYNSALWGRSTGGAVMATASLDGKAGLVVGALNAVVLLLGFGVALVVATGG